MEELCMNAAFLLFGINLDQLNATMVPTYLDHIPEGASTQSFVHYAQNFVGKDFQAYNYGEQGNLEHYGSETPPVFDLKKGA